MGSSASVISSGQASHTEALAIRFPVTRALAGDDAFRAMVHAFIEVSPPCSPVSRTYGEGFADFIDTFAPARSVPYLGDMARLEAARLRACHAADRSPLSVGELAAFAPHAWERCLAILHPSVQIVRSPYPIVTLWKASVVDPQGTRGRATPEDALVARTGLEAEVHRLPPGGAVFIQLLMSKATFREAADKAALADQGFDLVTSLSVLLSLRLIVGLGPRAER